MFLSLEGKRRNQEWVDRGWHEEGCVWERGKDHRIPWEGLSAGGWWLLRCYHSRLEVFDDWVLQMSLGAKREGRAVSS